MGQKHSHVRGECIEILGVEWRNDLKSIMPVSISISVKPRGGCAPCVYKVIHTEDVPTEAWTVHKGIKIAIHWFIQPVQVPVNPAKETKIKL